MSEPALKEPASHELDPAIWTGFQELVAAIVAGDLERSRKAYKELARLTDEDLLPAALEVAAVTVCT